MEHTPRKTKVSRLHAISRSVLTPYRMTDVQLGSEGIAMKSVPIAGRTVLSIPYASEARSDEAIVGGLTAVS